MLACKLHSNIKKIIFLTALLANTAAIANTDPVPNEQNSVVIAPQPLTKEEIRSGLELMQNKLNSRIEAFGQGLSADDWEWTWLGRQLNQNKRREVCGIFQSVVDEFYQMALDNKARLSKEDQERLNNRSTFIEGLGYQNNIVNTKMGFDCRMH